MIADLVRRGVAVIAIPNTTSSALAAKSRLDADHPEKGVPFYTPTHTPG